MKVVLPLFLVALACACRKDEITARHEPKDEAAVSAPAMSAPAHGVRWKLPSGWTAGPAGGMRVATLLPPASHGKAQATVDAFPGDVGGELANVNRWRGQIALPPLAAADLAGVRRVVRCRLGQVLVYDFTATGDSPSRVVAGMIKVRGTTWFFKLDGDARAVGADKPAFVRMLRRLTR